LHAGALTALTDLMPTLAKAERRVAKAVLADPEPVVRMTLNELSRAAGVGDATVVRLCQRAGWRGFAELRLRLAADLARPEDIIHTRLRRNDTPEQLLDKLSVSTVQAIRNSRKALSTRTFEAGVKAVSQARRTEFFGLGTSGLVAMNAKMRLTRVGLVCDAHTDVHFQRMAASRLDKRDVAFCISHSGETAETVQVMDIAKRRGATCIALTNHSRSSLAKRADIVLRTAVKEALLATGTMESEIAQLYVVNLLYVALATKNVPGVLETEVKYLDALRDPDQM